MTLRYAQTMAFTTLMLFQLFNVFNARSDERSAFAGLFTNRWLWISVALSLALHAAVIYTPFLQQAFSTTALDVRDWLGCAAVASSVLWLGELAKAIIRWLKAGHAKARLPSEVTPWAPRACETTPLLLTVNAGVDSNVAHGDTPIIAAYQNLPHSASRMSGVA